MDIITFFDYSGTLVFAISGVLTAINRKFDIVGASVIGMVTAIGGGTIRDLLIGSTPVAWMTNDLYIAIILGAVPLCYLFKARILRLKKSMFLFDTIGIGLFTILGIEKTLSMGLSPMTALLMGIISAVFGGVIRDVLCNEIPLIFRQEIYASACLAGGLVYLLLEYLSVFHSWNLLISILVVMVIRLLAVRFKWHLSWTIKS